MDGESADALMKKAEKLLRPSMLSMRLKPAWDDAMPLFEKAALQYKVICICAVGTPSLPGDAIVSTWNLN